MKIEQKIQKLIADKLKISQDKAELRVPEQKSFGDLSSNVLMTEQIEGGVKNELIEEIDKLSEVEKTEVVKPGFLNIYLSGVGYEKLVEGLLKPIKKKKKSEKIQLEYISANPTGPLTLGNGRGAFGGECLARIYKYLGYEVVREYYINDIGRQIEILGDSVIAIKEGKARKYKDEIYQGEYLSQIANEVEFDKDEKLISIGQKVADHIVEKYIKETVKKLGIEFDVWQKESDLYDKKVVDKALTKLKADDLIYQKKKADWFKATNFGDEKDRVVKRKNGEYTYFASDIGYSYDKFQNRKFDKVVMLLGADHHGYIDRMKGMLKFFDWDKKWLPVVFQLVRVIKDGKPIRMSKRKGEYYLLSDLIKEINPDVARFVFLSKDWNTPIDIDLDQLKKEDKNNPVYYLQYAFARINSLEKKGKEIKAEDKDEDFEYQSVEKELIMELSQFEEIIDRIGQNREVHLLTYYANQVAQKFHSFYNSCPVLATSKTTREKRLKLVKATKIVLQTSLKLMGISQPEKM